MTIDYIARQQATDLNNSVLLFAPAGSGKTSELVKRKLKSLLTADEPEAILSITFTNKAANELRDRVLRLLKDAAATQYTPPDHERESFEIAQQVLARDKVKGWGLLKNPNRLEVRTIDGLCNSIVRQFPLGSAIGAHTSVATNPHSLFEQAVDSFLSDYKREETWSEAVRTILSHLDNRFDKAKALLIQMLAQRDQWLPVLSSLRTEKDVKTLIENNNLRILNIMFQPLIAQFKPVECSLISIAHYASVNVDSEKFPFIALLYKADQIPSEITSLDDIAIIKGLCELLFTQSQYPNVRKTVNKSIGFVAPTSLKDPVLKEDAKNMKALASDVLQLLGDQLGETDIGFVTVLNDYKLSSGEWTLLKLCFDSLPILASKLMLIFKRTNQVDFIEMAGAAQVALGTELEPSPAALKLDKKYRHILVDEFQDTNMLQLSLLKRLTAGWELGDGRTLFLVGDPMQSIYMFRGSNISLFMLVSEFGINHIKPKILHLNANFRSQAKLVDWVNNCFANSFAKEQNKDTGAMSYNSSVPIKKALNDEPIDIAYYSGGAYRELEAAKIAKQICEIQEHDAGASIAILGKTRSDLSQIIETLTASDINHKAVKIHRLGALPSIIDLTALTRAICHIADKQAWVALLRSPLVGLSLSDILTVLGSLDGTVKKRDVILNRMKHAIRNDALSLDSRDRIRFAHTILTQSIEKLERRSLSKIVQGAYYSLGGLSTMTEKNELKNIDAFLLMLKKFSCSTFSIEKLEQELGLLFSKDSPTDTNVQMMTIHQAKGLEFDYVFIPSCHKGGRGDDKRLLESEVMYDENGNQCSTIMPSPETGVSSPCMYATIRSFRKLKQTHEATRLAYVAITRARKKAFLSGLANIDKGIEQFSRQSIFNAVRFGLPGIDTVVHSEITASNQRKVTQHSQLVSIPNSVLPQGQLLASFRGLSNINNQVLPKLQWSQDFAKKCGIAIHSVMEEIVEIGLTSFSAADLSRKRQRFATLILSHGADSRLVISGVKKVEEHVSNVINQDFSKWLFKLRPTAECEKEMVSLVNNKIQKRIIDYTFIENSMRYIFDYKTSEPMEGEPQQAFILRMVESHAQQIEMYERCFDKEQMPIKSGLVLTAIGKMIMYDQFKQDALVA